MNKKGLYITLAVAVVIAAAAYIAGSVNKNNDEVAARETTLPPYLLLTTTKIGEGTIFSQLANVTINKVENGNSTQTATLSNTDFLNNPIATKDGYKIFVTDDGGIKYYAFTQAGAISQMSVNPFTDLYSVDYIFTCEKVGAGVLPYPFSDGTCDKITAKKIGSGETTEYSPSTYGQYSEIEYVGLSSDSKYVYLFADNVFPGGNKLNSGLIKQNLSTKTDFEVIVSTTSNNGQFNSPTESLEFIASSKNAAYLKSLTNSSEGNYDDAKVEIKKIMFDSGEISQIGERFTAGQIFVFSQNRAYLMVEDNLESSTLERKVSVYDTSSGSLVNTLNALTCGHKEISNSGLYIGEICIGNGENRILNVNDGTRTTIATFTRPTDDSGYPIGYTETLFLDFLNPVE